MNPHAILKTCTKVEIPSCSSMPRGSDSNERIALSKMPLRLPLPNQARGVSMMYIASVDERRYPKLL